MICTRIPFSDKECKVSEEYIFDVLFGIVRTQRIFCFSKSLHWTSPFSSLLVPQYTIGLGQEFMAYSSDVEDINSYALTGGSALA